MGRGNKRRGSRGESSSKGEDKGSGKAAETLLERDLAASGLPQYLEDRRTRVFCGAEANSHVRHFSSAHSFLAQGVSNAEDGDDFRKRLDIRVNSMDDEIMEFDLVGVSPSFANALRRILLSEVTTMAIEHVFFLNNTSTIPDEIIAHRLGLIPILADPALFDHRKESASNDHANTIVFRLKIRCTRDGDTVINKKVYSKDLEWLPNGSEISEETNAHFTCNQKETMNLDGPIRPVHDDILIAKLSPGQEIELEAHCVKGSGAEHAKWSPVATAWYRLLPEVVLLKEISGDLADELLSQFPEDTPCPFSIVGSGSSRKVQVNSGRVPSECLERVRMLSGEQTWKDLFQLRKVKDHFIFTIESTGVIPPNELFAAALNILKSKAREALQKLALVR